MIVTCKECSTSFNLERKLIKPTGSKVRCSQCQSLFVVNLPVSEDMTEAVVSSLPPEPQAPTGEADSFHRVKIPEVEGAPPVQFTESASEEAPSVSQTTAASPTVEPAAGTIEMPELEVGEQEAPTAVDEPIQDTDQDEIQIDDIEKLLDIDDDASASQSPIADIAEADEPLAAAQDQDLTLDIDSDANLELAMDTDSDPGLELETPEAAPVQEAVSPQAPSASDLDLDDSEIDSQLESVLSELDFELEGDDEADIAADESATATAASSEVEDQIPAIETIPDLDDTSDEVDIDLNLEQIPDELSPTELDLEIDEDAGAIAPSAEPADADLDLDLDKELMDIDLDDLALVEEVSEDDFLEDDLLTSKNLAVAGEQVADPGEQVVAADAAETVDLDALEIEDLDLAELEVVAETEPEDELDEVDIQEIDDDDLLSVDEEGELVLADTDALTEDADSQPAGLTDEFDFTDVRQMLEADELATVDTPSGAVETEAKAEAPAIETPEEKDLAEALAGEPTDGELDLAELERLLDEDEAQTADEKKPAPEPEAELDTVAPAAVSDAGPSDDPNLQLDLADIDDALDIDLDQAAAEAGETVEGAELAEIEELDLTTEEPGAESAEAAEIEAPAEDLLDLSALEEELDQVEDQSEALLTEDALDLSLAPEPLDEPVEEVEKTPVSEEDEALDLADLTTLLEEDADQKPDAVTAADDQPESEETDGEKNCRSNRHRFR